MKLYWFPIYIYLDQRIVNAVLVNYIDPFCQFIVKQKSAKKYFFIRYNEGGYHIRLRFYTTEEHINNMIIPGIEEIYGRIQATWPTLVMRYTYAIYEPEIERYGGDHGVMIAEDHFCDSSKTVLAILKQNREWDYAKALGFSMQLHFSFMRAAKFNQAEAKLLLQSMFLHWYESAIDFYVTNIDGSVSRKEASQTVMQSFEKSFEKQREALTTYLGSFWDDLQHNIYETPLLKKWVGSVEKIHQRYTSFFSKGKIEIPADLPDVYTSDNFKLSVIYESLFHMTNNRLGILNMDEGFVGFIMLKLLDSLSFSQT